MEVENLSFSYDKKQKKKILDNISLHLPKGKITTFLGANGCGKSTLFQLMTKNLLPDSGIIRLEGKDIYPIDQKKFAKKVA